MKERYGAGSQNIALNYSKQDAKKHASLLNITECNNRFGGASSLSLAAGLDSFYWFLLESNGYPIGPELFIRSPEEKTQVRYAEDLIF